MDLKKLESQAYTNDRKVGIVATLEKAVHKYLSIVVCRNPVEKLLSVYKVTQDPRVGTGKLLIKTFLNGVFGSVFVIPGHFAHLSYFHY